MIRKIFALACMGAFLFAAARPSLRAAGATAASSAAPEEGTLKALAAVAGAGTMEAHTTEFLEELSDDIGGRVTGSPQAAKAIEWGVEKMNSLGLENVHTEPWQMSRGWTRISADAEIVSPIHRQLMVDSLGWVGSTPAGGVESDVVLVDTNRLDEEMFENARNWRGKVLLAVPRGPRNPDRFAEFVKFGEFLRAAYKAGALAVIGGQGGSRAAGMHLTHTGVVGFNTHYDIPVVSMAGEDQEQIERFLQRGKTVRLKLNVQNSVTDKPVDSANVVGEIRGSEHPEQIIVVGGHLDSWDLASGATDNGCGVSTTLGAAEAILKSGVKPRRTIRFVLFTGEEQGLLGSIAYTKIHHQEMANHVAAVVLDNGQGPVIGLQLGGRGDLIAPVQKFAASLQAFGEIGVNDDNEFDTDTGPFILAGLPAINLDQDSPDYRFTHHSAVDTFDHVRPDILDRNATVMALVGFWIADRPERLASPWPAERTARMLVDRREDWFLKAIGVWPFGNLGSDAENK